MEKFEEQKGRLEYFNESDSVDEVELCKIVKKLKKCLSILEELNLREKLVLKRSLTLCLILLK
jgi:hypothetical protein